MGQKRRKIFCVVHCGENFLSPPPRFPPSVTPKFYSSPRAILGGTSLLRHSPPLLKKVGAHVCSYSKKIISLRNLLFVLQCAMEENCLASEAYRLRHDRWVKKTVQKSEQMLVLINLFFFRVTISYDYATEMRRLLRFTAAIANIGSADFRWR